MKFSPHHKKRFGLTDGEMLERVLGIHSNVWENDQRNASKLQRGCTQRSAIALWIENETKTR